MSRVAIITGSTSGIGLGIAKRLAKSGCTIVLNGFCSDDEANKLKASIHAEFGVPVQYHGADMRNADQVQSLVDFSVSRFGSVDILVNNCGIQHVAPVEEFSLERWDAVIGTNLSSAFYSTKAALPHMKKNSFGRIVNVASVHGLVASANKSAYVAAKHGLVGLTKTVALETAHLPITCNAICPGWVLTPLVQQQVDALAESRGLSNDQAKEELLRAKQPSLKFGTVEALGDLVVYLCSPSASGITGVSLPMDGGWTAQ